MVSMILVGALLSGSGWAQQTARAPAREPLDLRPPQITQLYTPQQIDKILANTFAREDIEEVQVESVRDHMPTNTPRVWPGLGAVFWAMANPAQSWRIFAPLPPDQTRGLYARVDATDAYVLEPAGGLPPPAGMFPAGTPYTPTLYSLR